MKHNKHFWSAKHRELREWAKEYDRAHGTRQTSAMFNILMGTRSEFREFWISAKEIGEKDIMKYLKYNLLYSQEYQTALNEYRSVKEMQISKAKREAAELGVELTAKELSQVTSGIRLRDFKRMTHNDFIHQYGDDLSDYYYQLKFEYLRDGYSKKEAIQKAKSEIGMNWFGSPTK